jgi:hypothetical protein
MFTYSAPVSRGSISIRATNPDISRRYEVHGENVQVSSADLQNISDFFAEAAAAFSAQETEAAIALDKLVAEERAAASESDTSVPKGKRPKKAE